MKKAETLRKIIREFRAKHIEFLHQPQRKYGNTTARYGSRLPST